MLELFPKYPAAYRLTEYDIEPTIDTSQLIHICLLLAGMRLAALGSNSLAIKFLDMTILAG
jgi:hypothetical protein